MYIYAHIVQIQIVDIHSNVMIHLWVVKQIRMSTQHESPVMWGEESEKIARNKRKHNNLPSSFPCLQITQLFVSCIEFLSSLGISWFLSWIKWRWSSKEFFRRHFYASSDNKSAKFVNVISWMGKHGKSQRRAKKLSIYITLQKPLFPH